MIMDNQNNHINTFVDNQGFAAANNLPDLLGINDEAEEITNIKLSPYIDMHALSDKLYQSKSNLSIISLNAQSINAKFDEFLIAINQINKKHEISILTYYYVCFCGNNLLQPVPLYHAYIYYLQ